MLAVHGRRRSCLAAQDWPSRNVTVVVPLAAGIASDVVARVVFEQVGKQLGQTFVIENRPGAGGTIGANMVAKAAPDGHTVLVYGAIAAANALYSKLPYDTLNDFVPVMLVRPDSRWPWWSRPRGGYKTLADLVADSKGQAWQRLTTRSAGVGSAAHFGAERPARERRLRGAADSISAARNG